jgi:hypothetical protein
MLMEFIYKLGCGISPCIVNACSVMHDNMTIAVLNMT